MNKRSLITLIFSLLFMHSAYSLPKHFEVWFLSVPQNTWLDSILEMDKTSHKVALANLQCQPMGEHCFDPQVGLYKKDKANKYQEQIDLSEVEKNNTYDFMEVPERMEREMIDCDKSSFFDIFCGKAQKKAKQKKVKLEVWVDVSSTMKQVDFNGFDKKCSRETFLENLSQTCPMNEKMKIYYFEEFRKEAGSLDRVCLSGGLNEMKRIVSDLKKSTAENVIIITDIYEAQEEFTSAIEALGRGVIKGLDKPLYAKDIKKELQRVRPLCQ
jgi:hypothetical protein